MGFFEERVKYRDGIEDKKATQRIVIESRRPNGYLVRQSSANRDRRRAALAAERDCAINYLATDGKPTAVGW